MGDKVDLVSYICDGSSNTFPDSIFDGSVFESTHIPALEMMETLPENWMPDSTPQDLNLLSENFNLESLLDVRSEEQSEPVMSSSVVASVYGKQTIQDLLNAPTQPSVTTNRTKNVNVTTATGLAKPAKEPSLFSAPDSPQDIKPIQIPEFATTLPMATVAPFHSNTVSSARLNAHGHPVSVATSNSLPPTNLQTLLLSSTPQQTQVSLAPPVLSTLPQNIVTSNPQVSVVATSQPSQQQAVQTIDLVTALRQHPHLQEQLQRQLSLGQTAQINTTALTVSSLSPAPSPPAAAIASPPLQAVSPPLQTASPPVHQNLVGNNTIITPVPMLVDGCKYPIQRLTSANKVDPNPAAKRSHNKTEQRYRLSINDKITELRRLLVGDDSKISKSAVLKKAIDYIKVLTNVNRRLKTENNMLRKHLTANGTLTVKDLISHDLSIVDAEVDPQPCSFPTPPHSDPDSPLSGFGELEPPQTIDESITANEYQSQEPETTPTTGLLDRNRAALCLFMFSFLFFNPANSMFRAFAPDTSSAGVQNHFPAGRSILGIDVGPMTPAPKWFDWVFPTLLVWAINGFISLIVLWRLLVSMEPVTMNHSKSSTRHRHFRMLAEEAIEEGDYASAHSHLQRSLIAISRPLPTSRFDQCCAIVWNLFRLLLGMIRLGPWLTRQKCKQSVRNSARDAAQVYHLLDQLQLTGKISSSNMMGFVYSLNAINLCEVAGWMTTPPDVATKIYVTAAFRFKQFAPPVVRLLFRYFLSEARSVINTHTDCVEHLRWICHPKGHQFIVNEDWSYENEAHDAKNSSIEFSQVCDSTDPLSYAAFHFRKHLLQSALYSLVNPAPVEEEDAFLPASLRSKKLNPYHEALEQLLLLKETSEDDDLDDDDCFAENRFWWSAATVSAQWIVSDDVSNSDLYQYVERPPQSLTMSKNPLPKALMWAFVAKRDFLLLEEDIKNDPTVASKYVPSLSVVLQRCNQASRLLRESLMCSHNRDPTSMAFHAIICEWLLSTRTGLWQATSCYDDVTRNAPVEHISALDADIHLLRMIAEEVPGVVCKVHLHEATLRMMAGANPNKTQRLIERTLRRRHNSKADKVTPPEAGARERAYALSLACRHLPSQMYSAPGQKVGMIQDAMGALKRLGYHKGVEDCQKLLLKVEKTASA